MKSLSSTISTIRFETLSDLDTHMKFLMKIPLLTDSMIESIEEKILEASTPLTPPTPPFLRAAQPPPK